MSQQHYDISNSNLCLHCEHDETQRFQRIIELQQWYAEERQKGLLNPHYARLDELEQKFQEQRKFLGNKAICLHCSEANMRGHYVNCPVCSLVQQKLDQRDHINKEMQQKWEEPRSNCKHCSSLKLEIEEKEHAIEDYKKMCDELRCQAEINKKNLDDFKDRMSVEASAEIACSSEIFEDINNPCRESELTKRYEMLRLNKWPKCLQKIKEKSNKRRGETADEKKEKETVERMIKKVFDKASTDMKKKKELLHTFFKTSDSTKSVNNKKISQCMDMAVQNLQMMILYENCTHYQDINEELGHNEPDYLCELADDCYKQGCLMALHNPPLTLDWNNKEKHYGCPFPPIKLG